jgi:hypothetical protein
VATDRRQKKKGNARADKNGNGSDLAVERHRLSSPAIGWEAYRGWLGRLDRHGTKRQGPDSIYTWKGYQAWTAKVRADWEQEG